MIYATANVSNDIGMSGMSELIKLLKIFDRFLEDFDKKLDYLVVIKETGVPEEYEFYQEQPEMRKTFKSNKLPKFEEEKIWYIDNGEYATFLYPSEY